MSKEELQDFYERQYERDLTEAPLLDDHDFLYGQVLFQIKPYMGTNVRVLDLGCNTGALSMYMGKKGCTVLGIDIADNAVRTAQRSADRLQMVNVTFRRMDFLEEWTEAEAFDFVLCAHVIEHVPDDTRMLKQIARAMKNGARLVLMTPTVYSLLYRFHRWVRRPFQFDVEVGHIRRYDKAMLVERLTEAGFAVQNIVYLDSPLRELLFIPKTLRKLHVVLGLPGIRRVVNSLDLVAARLLFPATICVHAERR